MIDEKKFNRIFSTVLMSLMVVAIVVTAGFKMGSLRGDSHSMVMLILASFASIMGVASTILSANGAILTFIFGIINVGLVAFVALDNGIMGNFALHAFYFLPMQFVGIWQWRKRGAGSRSEDGKESSRVQARRLTPRQRIYVLLAHVAGIIVSYLVLDVIDDGKIGAFDGKIFLDASVFAFNIGGQILMSLAYMEQWVLWNLVNISSIGLWGYATWADGASGYTIVMFIKYCFYFVNSLNGLRIWLNLSKPGRDGSFA